jgi:predicted transcriptional regulator
MSELTTQEKLIYDLIQEYLASNRLVEMNRLESFLKMFSNREDINLNLQGIRNTIQSLIKKNFIVEGSRLTKDAILENEKRRTIFEYILNNPAVYHYLIMKELKIPNHIVVWHLNVLLDFNFIYQIQIKNHKVYSTPNINPYKAKVIFYSRNEKSSEIINYLSNIGKSCSKNELSQQLGMHHKTINKYLNDLVEISIVRKNKIGNKTTYSLNSTQNKLNLLKNIL